MSDVLPFQSLLENIWLRFLAFFPYAVPFIILFMLRYQFRVRWTIWRWFVTLIFGEVISFLALVSLWMLERYQTFTTYVYALEKLNLIIIVLIVGIYFYMKRRKSENSGNLALSTKKI